MGPAIRMGGKLIIRCIQLSDSQLGGYRSVKGPHFGTAPESKLALMRAWL